MTQRLENEAMVWDKYPEIAEGLTKLAARARTLGAPEQFPAVNSVTRKESPKFYPEISLEEDLANQRHIIIERLVRPLGIDEEDALKQLSFVFPGRKKPYNRLEHIVRTPILVPQLNGVSWLVACDKLGFTVSDYLRKEIEADRVQPWQDSRGIRAPGISHGIWVQDGTMFVNRKPVDVREELNSRENSDLDTGDLWRGFALALLRPDMVLNKGWDLIGDSVDSDRVPCVGGWDGRPRFLAGRDDGALPHFRAFVCGS